MAFLWRKNTLWVQKEENGRDVYFHNISSSNSAEPLPLSFRIKDERQLREHQARQEMLLAKRDRDLEHGGHSLVLHHAGER